METILFLFILSVLIVAGIVATIINLAWKDQEEQSPLLGVVLPKKKEDDNA